jgi:serine O-acetyltransferase
MTVTVADELARKLAEERTKYAYPPGFRAWPERFANRALGLLFPHYADSLSVNPHAILSEIARLRELLIEALEVLPETRARCEEISEGFADSLIGIREELLLDAEAVYAFDPASECIDEVIFAYPGFYATAIYRIAHSLSRLQVPLLPRLLSEHAHRTCGIDIHPGATIGHSFFIDHGTGIVIGETAVLGDRVKLYQGVTLGAHQVNKRLAGSKRHPTVEDDVVVYAHATILGDIVVGAKSVIGGNTWITQSVPANTVVANRTAVRRTAESDAAATNQTQVPDFSI